MAKNGAGPRMAPPMPGPSKMVKEMTSAELQKLAVQKEDEALRIVDVELQAWLDARGFTCLARYGDDLLFVRRDDGCRA